MLENSPPPAFDPGTAHPVTNRYTDYSIEHKHTPADYFLFPKMKSHLKGRLFDSISDIQKAVTSGLDVLTFFRGTPNIVEIEACNKLIIKQDFVH